MWKFPRTGKIPSKLYDSETSEPIRHCQMCEKDLIENNTPYLLQKSFRRFPSHELEEVVFEFAICDQCNLKMHEELSEESKQMMQQYMNEQVNPMMSRPDLEEAEEEDYDLEPDFNKWVARCPVTGKTPAEMDEYIIVAQGQGDQLHYSFLPMVLSFEVQDEMQEMLSEKTKGFLDDFSRNHFSGPPGVEELIGPRRPILV